MYVVLRPTPHKTGHFGDVSPSKESLGLVRRKLNLTQQKQTFTTHTHTRQSVHLHTHTHPFTGPLSGTTPVSRYQKGKTIWILLEHETVSGSGIRRATCKSAARSRQMTTPAPHCSVFLQPGCPSCRPTNSVKALKATKHTFTNRKKCTITQNKHKLAI